MKFEKSCGAVIFRRTDVWNVLLIRHTKGRHISFPKGHMEAGETESQTAEREILEETGLRVRVDRRFRAENRYNIRPDTQKLVVIFAALSPRGEIVPQPEEIAEAFWLPVEDAANRLTYERDRKIMRDAFAHIQKHHALGGTRARAGRRSGKTGEQPGEAGER